jgi:hypothetical protein
VDHGLIEIAGHSDMNGPSNTVHYIFSSVKLLERGERRFQSMGWIKKDVQIDLSEKACEERYKEAGRKYLSVLEQDTVTDQRLFAAKEAVLGAAIVWAQAEIIAQEEVKNPKYGIWCVEDRAWCPVFCDSFLSSKEKAETEIAYWRNGIRADVTPGSFTYEVAVYDPKRRE